MNETVMLYLFTRLDGLKTMLAIGEFVFIVGASSFALFAVITAGSSCNESEHTLLRRWLKPLTIGAVLCSILQVVVPSNKEAMFIIAGTGVIEAAKSPDVQRVAGKAAAAFEGVLDEYLDKKDKGNRDKKH